MAKFASSRLLARLASIAESLLCMLMKPKLSGARAAAQAGCGSCAQLSPDCDSRCAHIHPGR